MRKDDLVYVGHALDTAKRVNDKVHGLERGGFDRDENLRLAVLHLLQVVGEAVSRVSRGFRDAHPAVPWAAIAGMRHRIVHDYMDVDEDVVWRTASSEMGPLIRHLEEVLRANP